MARRGAIENVAGVMLSAGRLTRAVLQQLGLPVSRIGLEQVGEEEIAEVPWSKMKAGALPVAVKVTSSNYAEDGAGMPIAGWQLTGDGQIHSPGLRTLADGTIYIGVGTSRLTVQPNGDFVFGIGGAAVTITHDGTLFVGGTDAASSPFVVDKSGSVTVRRTDGVVHAIDIAAISGTVQPPIFSPDGGSFDTTLAVSIINKTAGSAMYYTTDGSAPSTSSTLYTGPFTISADTTVKAIAVKLGQTSTTATKAYVKNGTPGDKVQNPTFSPAPGTYSPTGGGQAVVISCATAGATIRYTTDGTAPSTTHGTIIATGSSVTLTTGTTSLKALAYNGVGADSDVVTGSYTINSGGVGGGTQVATPTWNQTSGTQGVTPIVGTLLCATSGATIKFRAWNGSTYGAWTTYAGPVSIPLNRFIEFYALKAGLLDSETDTQDNYA